MGVTSEGYEIYKRTLGPYIRTKSQKKVKNKGLYIFEGYLSLIEDVCKKSNVDVYKLTSPVDWGLIESAKDTNKVAYETDSFLNKTFDEIREIQKRLGHYPSLYKDIIILFPKQITPNLGIFRMEENVDNVLEIVPERYIECLSETDKIIPTEETKGVRKIDIRLDSPEKGYYSEGLDKIIKRIPYAKRNIGVKVNECVYIQ